MSLTAAWYAAAFSHPSFPNLHPRTELNPTLGRSFLQRRTVSESIPVYINFSPQGFIGIWHHPPSGSGVLGLAATEWQPWSNKYVRWSTFQCRNASTSRSLLDRMRNTGISPRIHSFSVSYNSLAVASEAGCLLIFSAHSKSLLATYSCHFLSFPIVAMTSVAV